MGRNILRIISFVNTAAVILKITLPRSQAFSVGSLSGQSRRALAPASSSLVPDQCLSNLHKSGSSSRVANFHTSTTLEMKKNGKTVKKENLPCKVCVVCGRPFTWRKKWERNWDEITTCSKSCNSKRRAENRSSRDTNNNSMESEDDAKVKNKQKDGKTSKKSRKERLSMADGLHLDFYHRSDEISSGVEDHQASSSISDSDYKTDEEPVVDARKQHKAAVKAQKAARRAKRMGEDVESGRKPCDLCSKRVDMLIRCTIDESRRYKMVCGKCWKDVSGGVPDGDEDHPHYTYGGLWKNRSANQKKKVGDGSAIASQNLQGYQGSIEVKIRE